MISTDTNQNEDMQDTTIACTYIQHLPSCIQFGNLTLMSKLAPARVSLGAVAAAQQGLVVSSDLAVLGADVHAQRLQRDAHLVTAHRAHARLRLGLLQLRPTAPTHIFLHA